MSRLYINMFKRLKLLSILPAVVAFSHACACCGRDGDRKSEGDIPVPSAPANHRYAKPAGTVRLLTYNSFYCKSNTPVHAFTEKNTKAFADVIRSLDADLVAIQELDSGTTSRGRRFLLQQINDMTSKDYQLIFGHAAGFDNGAIGCGLLINPGLGILHVRKKALPGHEARILIIAELRDFVVMATHLDLNVDARKASARIIADEARKYEKPVFLAGDFNDSPEWDDGNSCFSILKQYFSVCKVVGGAENSGIDHVMLSASHTDQWDTPECHVIRHLCIDGNVKDLTPVSDHYPVYIDFKKK